MKEIEENKSVFATLSRIDVSGRTEKIGQLTYLSWAWAWGFIKENYPDATYTIYKDARGHFYHDDGRTAWVETGLTINGLEHIEMLPVMDNRHNSIPLERITSRNVNDTIQRSLTKAAARHGLGLNVYAGEDLLMFREDGQETGSRAASSDKPIIDTTGSDKPVGTTEKPVSRKRTVTLADCEKGKAVNLVADLARYNHDNLPEWEAGKGAIKYRKNEKGDITAELTIEPEAMEWIEREAISYRKSLGK